MKNPDDDTLYSTTGLIPKIVIPTTVIPDYTSTITPSAWEIKANTNEENGYVYKIKIECLNENYSNGP